jgi:hypothetical protein
MKVAILVFLFAVVAPSVRAESSLNTAPWVPESLEGCVKRQGLEKRYELSFHLNPFYLRGDFRGDGKIDVAALIREKRTGKVGIVVCRADEGAASVLGAGKSVGNGGDDFAWLDYWSVQGRDGAKSASGGEALLVGKRDSASALISWNGKTYVWRQQGD